MLTIYCIWLIAFFSFLINKENAAVFTGTTYDSKKNLSPKMNTHNNKTINRKIYPDETLDLPVSNVSASRRFQKNVLFRLRSMPW